MRFLHPQALWLLTLSAPLVALYLVRRRARRSLIASLSLWERAVASMKSKPVRQWPAEVLCLIMNLVILACATLALAEPVSASPAPLGRDVFLVLDASAGMYAVVSGDARTRIETAVDNLKAALASLGPQDRCALIVAQRSPEVLADLGSGRNRIKMLLDEVPKRKPIPTRGSLSEAVDFILRSHHTPAQPDSTGSSREIVIVLASDGQERIVPAAMPSGVRLVENGPRTRGDNAGIVFASVQRADKDSAAALVRVVNHSVAPRELTLSARFSPDADSQGAREAPSDAGTLTLHAPADGAVESLLEILCPSAGTLTLSLLPADALMLDNSAELRVEDFARTRVILASAASDDAATGANSDGTFLWAALDAMGDRVDRAASVRMSLELLKKMVRTEADPLMRRTVLICAGRGDEKERGLADVPETLPLLSFGLPTGSQAANEAARNMVQLPARCPISWNEGHPIVRGVETSDISIAATFIRELAENETPLARTTSGVIALAGVSEARKYVWFGFPLSRTNLTVLPAFPLVMRNALGWLSLDSGRNAISEHKFPAEESNLLQDESSASRSAAIPASGQASFVFRPRALSIALAAFAGVVALAEWVLFCWRRHG